MCPNSEMDEPIPETQELKGLSFCLGKALFWLKPGTFMER